MQIKASEDLRAGDFVNFGGQEYEIVGIASFEKILIIYFNILKDENDGPSITVTLPKGIEVMTS